MKKMMLNDVVENISDHQNNEPVSVTDIDKIKPELDDEKEIVVELRMRYGLLRELKNNLKKKYGENHPSVSGYIYHKIQKINEEFQEFQLQQHTASLSFDGKKPRKDVLLKLLKIADEVRTYPDADILKRWHVEKIIRTALDKPDDRTVKKYLDCLQNYVKAKTGREVYFNTDYKLFDLKTTVLEMLKETERKNENLI